MIIRIRPTRPKINWPLMFVIGCLLTIVAVIWAQQPVSQGPQASTAAAWKITGNGSAGTADTNVVTIQGISGAVAVPVSGTFWQTTQPVSFGPITSSTGATTLKHSSSAAAANAKASAGNLYGYALGNSGTVACWLQLFNNASTPTAGSSVIDSIMVQAGVTVISPPGAIAPENFSTGIAFAGATSDSGSTTTGCTTTFSVSLYYE